MSCLLLALALCAPTWAAESSESPSAPLTDNFAYHPLEPEIVTNYISQRKNLGFVRLQVELMVESEQQLEEVAYHDPLLRAAVLEIVGRQDEAQIRSLNGRDAIREECLETLNRLLTQETGKPLISNLLITKYLYE